MLALKNWISLIAVLILTTAFLTDENKEQIPASSSHEQSEDFNSTFLDCCRLYGECVAKCELLEKQNQQKKERVDALTKLLNETISIIDSLKYCSATKTDSIRSLEKQEQILVNTLSDVRDSIVTERHLKQGLKMGIQQQKTTIDKLRSENDALVNQMYKNQRNTLIILTISIGLNLFVISHYRIMVKY